jgi:acetolactate synthase-1/2/3 large subunit
MNGAQWVVHALRAQGVDTVFGYPGGAIMPIYDALYDGGVEHLLCRHEQGAAMAAIGYARATGKTGVCIATSGPGATNLITGLADALLDSVPVVAITGQVASPFIGTDAFQEVDVLGLSLACTKHSFLVQSLEELPRVMAEAFDVANSGRPGPVLVDIPKDIQVASAIWIRISPPLKATMLSACGSRRRQMLAQAKSRCCTLAVAWGWRRRFLPCANLSPLRKCQPPAR